MLFLISRGQMVAKHREEKDKKDKEEVKVKEETNVKMNHIINQGYHYNMKPEIKEVRFRFTITFRGINKERNAEMDFFFRNLWHNRI